GIALVLRIMRVRQPALRHGVWTGVLAVMLLLPAWVAWGPKTSLPVLPVASWQRTELTRTAIETSSSLEFQIARSGQVPAVSSPQASTIWRSGFLVLYFVGAGALLLRLAIAPGALEPWCAERESVM